MIELPFEATTMLVLSAWYGLGQQVLSLNDVLWFAILPIGMLAILRFVLPQAWVGTRVIRKICKRQHKVGLIWWPFEKPAAYTARQKVV